MNTIKTVQTAKKCAVIGLGGVAKVERQVKTGEGSGDNDPLYCSVSDVATAREYVWSVPWAGVE